LRAPVRPEPATAGGVEEDDMSVKIGEETRELLSEIGVTEEAIAKLLECDVDDISRSAEETDAIVKAAKLDAEDTRALLALYERLEELTEEMDAEAAAQV
jgi:hypothetical protein